MPVREMTIGRPYGPFLTTYPRAEERDLGVLVTTGGEYVAVSVGWPDGGFVLGVRVPRLSLKRRRWHRVLRSAR